MLNHTVPVHNSDCELNLGDATCHLEDVRVFLGSKGYANEATTIASAVDMVASLHCRVHQRARQSTFDHAVQLNNICY